jgi:hypothetical protein
MSTHDVFGWRDRAIALASLGAAALSRSAFAPGDDIDPQPLQMQVLLALALQDSLTADPPHRTDTYWLSIALGLEQAVVEQVVRRLERENLVRRSPDAVDEIQWELGDEDDEDVIAGELSIVVTELGLANVDRWLSRSRPYFGGWPPRRADVDDAVG